ncbi:MAG: hypothetical protein K0S74_963 [Chlamydiales bacterium]|jgi:CBS domain containing-hemolysin-like protein|nr:hypothetical protein [Chlamydiales bacterium]
MLLITLFLITLFLVSSALFSATETALFSLPPVKVQTYQSQANKNKQLAAQLLSRPQDLIVTLLMLNVCANILVQNLVSHLVGEEAGWILKVGIPLILTLLFGELFPKSLAMQYNDRLAPHFAAFIAIPYRYMGPIRSVLTKIVNPVSNTMFCFLKKEQEISKQELQHVLTASQNYGILTDDEANLINGYLELQDKTVKELTRPREEILYYDCNTPLSELKRLFSHEQCSRVPVCDHSLENLLGVITAQQYFTNQIAIEQNTISLNTFLQKPFFAPETIPARVLLRQFYEKKEQIAIVVDEYGEVSGLIAREDLVEIVVGEIRDRRDQTKDYIRTSHNVIIANGKLELHEFEQLFGVSLNTNDNMVTLAGWVLEQLKMIPKSGAKLKTEHFFFHVLEADPQKIKKIYIRKLEPPHKHS